MNVNDFFWSLYPGAKGYPRPSDQLHVWGQSGEYSKLLETAIRLENDPLIAKKPQARQGEIWMRQALFDDMIRFLSNSTRQGSASTLIKIAVMPRVITTRLTGLRSTQIAAQVADLLVTHQTPETLYELFSEFANAIETHELLACLAQEMVLRRIDVLNTPIAEFYERRIALSSHPLAWLPLELLPCESAIEQLLAGQALVTFERTGDIDDELIPFQGVTQPILPFPSARIKTCVSTWETDSNGVSEVKKFELDETMTLEMLTSSLLRSLKLECLTGENGTLEIQHISFEQALAILWGCARSGGAYDHGYGAAYGRWAAWRSIEGFVGDYSNASMPEVAERAQNCAWLAFRAQSDWFYDVAWDIGLAVLRPDGRTLVTFAATDTD